VGTIVKSYNLQSKSFLNQEPIFGGRGYIYTTTASNGTYQFRTWVQSEKHYFRKSLRTKIKADAIKLGEDLMVSILYKVQHGHKISGFSWGELCQDFLAHQRVRVTQGRITDGRFRTIKTQVNKHFLHYLSGKILINEINIDSFLDYASFRRTINPEVTDGTIRNEHTTINAIIKYGHRKKYTPVSKVHVEEIWIDETARRDAFTYDEIKSFKHHTIEWVKETNLDEEKYYRKTIGIFWFIAARSFARFGELRQLKWSMVKTTTEKSDAGKIIKLLYLDLPARICKNRKPRIVLCIGGDVLMGMKRISKFTGDDDYVFSRLEENKMISKSQYYRLWNSLLKFSKMTEQEINKKLTYYSLRHFGITMKLYAKTPHYDVAKIAGTSVQFIERHYEHLEVILMKRDVINESVEWDQEGFLLR
jgi:integrase